MIRKPIHRKKNPNWPKDPDAARRAAERAENRRPIDQVRGDAGRPLNPDELMRGAVPNAGRETPTGTRMRSANDSTRDVLPPLRISRPRWAHIIWRLFSGAQPAQQEFRGEPPRQNSYRPACRLTHPFNRQAYTDRGSTPASAKHSPSKNGRRDNKNALFPSIERALKTSIGADGADQSSLEINLCAPLTRPYQITRSLEKSTLPVCALLKQPMISTKFNARSAHSRRRKRCSVSWHRRSSLGAQTLCQLSDWGLPASMPFAKVHASIF